MNIDIEYCGMWGYEPRARAARDQFLTHYPDASVTLTRSGGGVFEITVNGRLGYSKKASGRFPTPAEVLQVVS